MSIRGASVVRRCSLEGAPTCATNRREPRTLPSSAPQNTFKRALFDRGATLVQLLELLRRPWQRWKPAEVDLPRHSHCHAVRFVRVADLGHRARPAFVLRRTDCE